MRIEEAPPFELTVAPDGVKTAVKGHIQVSVFPDVGEVKMKHRRAKRPGIQAESRWLYINLVDKNLRIYVHGTHVVVAEAELLGTFTTNSRTELLELAFKHLKAHKTEKNRYVVDTEKNRKIINDIFEMVELGIKSRLLAEMNHSAAAVLGKDL